MVLPVLRLPPLDESISWLRALADPIVRLGLARRFGEEQESARLRGEMAASRPIQQALGAQRADGSWADDDEPRRRVLPTLWMTKVLAELGLRQGHPGWDQAVAFISAHAHTDAGVFSLDGGDGGVLSCYVGIAGETYLLGGRPDLARAQIEWITRYQDVSVDGASRRSLTVETFDDRLRARYGGCLADTTCLIGLVKTGRALLAWERHAPDPRTRELVAAIREAYLERRLMFRSDGGIVPIGVYGGASDHWLQPAFPLDWHTDLVEVLEFVAASGSPDPRMQPAIDRLASLRLADGSWPLRQSYRPAPFPAMERRSKTKGSPLITLRVTSALAACGATHSPPCA